MPTIEGIYIIFYGEYFSLNPQAGELQNWQLIAVFFSITPGAIEHDLSENYFIIAVVPITTNEIPPNFEKLSRRCRFKEHCLFPLYTALGFGQLWDWQWS